jgi:hypothetical protein
VSREWKRSLEWSLARDALSKKRGNLVMLPLKLSRHRQVERDLISGLFGDDDTRPEEQEPTPCDPDGNGSAQKRM